MNINNIITIGKNSLKTVIRKKDFYSFLILLIFLLIYFSSKTILGTKEITRFLKDIGYTCTVLFSVIITIVFGSKQIPEELSEKTIYPLLAKPVSRQEFMLGKYFGTLLIGFFCYSCFYILFLSFAFSKSAIAAPVLFLQSYLCGLLMLSMIASINILLSTVVTISANVTLSLLIYFFSMWFGNILRTIFIHSKQLYSFICGMLYYMLPHYEFFDLRLRLVHEWEPLPAWIMTSVIIYAIVYIALILTISIKIFNKKTL